MKRKIFFIISLVITAIIVVGESKADKISSEVSDLSKIKLLSARIMDQTFKDINSIIVVKKGKVLVEEYFNGEGHDTLHDIRSAGKSITSALVGIAIDKGLVRGVDEKLFSFFPGVECQSNLDPRKKTISLKHVLSMSFGLAEPGEYPSWENRAWYTINWIGDVLCQPIEYEPGSQFDYDSAAPALFGPIIEQSSGLSVGQFAEDFLFQPLGIEHYKWHILPNGKEYTGGGFRMRPRDMARFGQLYLQKGTWKGEQLISKKWVGESTKAHLVANARLDVHYGYYWWREAFLINDQWIETYFASGNGGNKIYVFPNRDLVVVITASAYNKSYGHPQVRMMMNKYILPDVIQNDNSLPKEPILKTVPQTGFVISELFFLFTILLCILWPLNLLSKPCLAEQPMPNDSKGNSSWLHLFRIWIGINALVGIIFVGIVSGEAETLFFLLNSGYAQPIYPALHKVIGSWAIVILTGGSLVLSVQSWRGCYWSNLERSYFSIHVLVSLYCVFTLGDLGLLFFVC